MALPGAPYLQSASSSFSVGMSSLEASFSKEDSNASMSSACAGDDDVMAAAAAMASGMLRNRLLSASLRSIPLFPSGELQRVDDDDDDDDERRRLRLLLVAKPAHECEQLSRPRTIVASVNFMVYIWVVNICRSILFVLLLCLAMAAYMHVWEAGVA
mmetsp:Transcript_32057/g.67388  ORF Transcript_32057/g.67388 Transcript_32057/m.67388 type:complete len:157 (+) Transcript_32057:279-749(+)